MYYGFDVGGTKIALSMFDSGRQLQWEEQMPTPRDNYDAFLDVVCELVAEADQCSSCKGPVGIDIPGTSETEDDTLYAANVPAASGKPLCINLSARLNRDVCLDDDANCFALLEVWDDEFTQYPSVMRLIPDTSVDGGLISNGKPITSKSYITGEFDHMRLSVDALTTMGLDFPLHRYGCGQHGCIENYLSGRSFVWLYQHYYHQPLQAPEIIALYDRSDGQTGAHVEHHPDLLAVCLGNILAIVGPDLIVIGGGLLGFSAVATRLVDRLPRHLLSVVRVPHIERARHGDAGGMRGAAFLHLTD